mgnify:CR=1 FL=1
MASFTLQGIPVSRGIAIGRAHVLQVDRLSAHHADGTSAVGSVVLWDKARAAELFTSLGAK